MVTPALRTAVGTETSLPPITIKPGEVASLDLYKTLLQSAPSLVGSWGSLVLRYRSPAHRALYAALMLRADGRPMVFHLDAYERGKNYDSGHREGIWWLPWDAVSDYLILTNSGDQPLQPALQLSDSTGASQTQMLTLAPFETRRLSVRALLSKSGLSGSYGGIKITAAKNARYLDSVHLLFEESGNFSALMKMFKNDPRITAASRSFGGVSEWTIRAPMLALTHPDPTLAFPSGTVLQPKVFLRNASGRALTAHLHFNWRSDSKTGKTAPIGLVFKPNETKLVDVAALQDQNVLPPDAYWAAVIVSAPVQPDELLAVAASYDQTGSYGAQTPFSDQLASHWEAGKWEVDGTHDSLITIANGSNKPAVARLTILYHQGSGSYQIEQPLAPDEQMWVDFGKLIHEQIPDKNGATLPPDLTEGTYRLVDLNDNPLGSLYEGKVIVDKTFGHATYGCMICCGPNNPWMMYDPLPIAISDFENQDVQAINSCSNRLTTVTSDFPSWWTDNSSIATATGRQINGIAVGTTNHNAQSQLMYWGDKEDSGGGACPLDQPVVSAPTNVTPHIDSISPAQGPIGQTTNGVTISGRGFGASPTVNAGPNITVTITSKTDAQIVANFAVSSSAAIGAQPVTIAVTGVPPSNSVNFTIVPSISQSTPLWFFGTGVPTPSGFTLGATSATLTVNGSGASGTFQWSVTNGTSKLAFSNGSSSITLTNSNSVTVYAASYSTSRNDVTLQVVFTPPGGTAGPPGTLSLTIDSPYNLIYGPVPPPQGVSACITGYPAGNSGWYQLVPYLLQSRFGAAMSHTPVNESFGQRMDQYPGNNYPSPTPGPTTTSILGSFSDNLCAAGSGGVPQTQAPQNPLSSVLVFQIAQIWSAGTLTTASGVEVQEAVLNFYVDHGAVSQITSPVP